MTRPRRQKLGGRDGMLFWSQGLISYSFCLVSSVPSRANVTFILLTFWKMLLNVNGDYFYMGRDHVWHTRTCRTFARRRHGDICPMRIDKYTDTYTTKLNYTTQSWIKKKKILLPEKWSNDPHSPLPANLCQPLSLKLFFLLFSLIFSLTSVAALTSYLISFLMLWGTREKLRRLTSTLRVSAWWSSHLLTSTLIITDSVSKSFPFPQAEGWRVSHVERATR